MPCLIITKIPYDLKHSLFILYRLIQEPQAGFICYNVLFILLNVCLQPLLLTGHHGEVTAMTFGNGSRPVLLCSASADYIIVWDIEQCQQRAREGKELALCVLMRVQCICSHGQSLACCIQHEFNSLLFILLTLNCRGHLCTYLIWYALRVIHFLSENLDKPAI